MHVVEVVAQDEWNEDAERFGAHPLQWWQWGELKAKTPVDRAPPRLP